MCDILAVCSCVIQYLQLQCALEGPAHGAAAPAAEQALLQEGHVLHVPLHFRRSVLITAMFLLFLIWMTKI
jgi:hypothetical protein